jgi:hypothetical protein
MSEAPVDLSTLAHQQRQIITDLAAMRDDMAVLTAIAMRQDGTLTTLLTEIRAMHSQHGRLATRVRDLETSGTPRSGARRQFRGRCWIELLDVGANGVYLRQGCNGPDDFVHLAFG